MGSYNRTYGTYEKPTIPTNIGTALKYIGNLNVSDAIKNLDEETKVNTENLLVLLKTDLNSAVNKIAIESLLQHKRQKTILPCSEDIKKLNIYLLENLNKYYNVLNKGYNKHAWIQLGKYSLVQVLVFNLR